jgi:hypothetical protein
MSHISAESEHFRFLWASRWSPLICESFRRVVGNTIY